MGDPKVSVSQPVQHGGQGRGVLVKLLNPVIGLHIQRHHDGYVEAKHALQHTRKYVS